MIFILISLSFLSSGEVKDFKGTHLDADLLPYGKAPYKFQGSQLVSIIFQTSPEVLRALVPEPLVPNPENLMTITLGLQKVVEPGVVDYHEVYFTIPVTYGEIKGSYFPLLYLDKAIPIVAGREIWGYPKLYAEIQMVREKDEIQIKVVRENKAIIKASVKLGVQMGPMSGLPDKTSINLKLIPSAIKDSPPDVKQLTSSIAKNQVVKKLFVAEAKLEFDSTPLDPLKSIPIKKIVRAFYSESDFVLDYGQVIHDYLKK
jgi:acetoacetate decarboxylase